MANATFNQPSFLGGEWSPAFQGRIDDPHYKIAMNLSSNGYPVEEGAWTRRSGFRRTAPTFRGQASRLWAFNYSVDLPFMVEVSSQGFLRILSGDAPLLDSTANLLSIDTNTPTTIQVDGGGNNWATGDEVILIPASGWGNDFGSLPNQTFIVTALGGGRFTLADSVTGNGIDGSQVIFTFGQPQATIGRIFRVATPWTGNDWYDVTTQVIGNSMFFFHKNYVPYELTLANLNTATPNVSTFTFGAAFFHDGPYLDPVAGQTATVSGVSGTITVTFANGFGPNQSVPTTADVGRLIRLWNTPLAWNSGTSYPGASNVTFGGLYFTSLKTTTAGLPPTLAPQEWYPNPNAAAWVWGVIASIVGPAQVTLQLEYNLLYADTITMWQLGAIGDPGNNPTCGCGHENRLWMFAGEWIYGSQSGALDPNDRTPTDQLWSPTEINGTVVDASAISYKLETTDEDKNSILWAITGPTGMILGSAAGEWVVKASQLDDPLTPTSIQARRVTRYKTYKAKPVNTPLATVFVQKYQRKVMEFLPDVFTGRYVAPNLSATAKHLTTNGVEELAYQEEITPIIWARDTSGNLIGATYRRTSAFVSEAPAFVGWHRHAHGQGRLIKSLQTSPDPTGSLDCIYTVTSLNGANYQIERLVKQFDTEDSVYSAWFLDNASTPSAMVDLGTGIQLWGFYDKVGLTVEVFIGGLDLGAYTVGSLGQITVPYTSTFTSSYLQSLNGQNFGEAATHVKFAVSTTPVRSPTPSVIGNYLNSSLDATSTYNVNSSTAVDFGRNQFYTIAGTIGGATSFEIHSYNLTTRAAGTSVNAHTIEASTNQANCFVVAPNGNLLLVLASFDQNVLYQVNPSTMTVVSSYGANQNVLPWQGTAATLGHVLQAAAVGCIGGNYLVTVCGVLGFTAGINIVNIDTMTYAYGPAPACSPTARLCVGATGQTGVVYLLDNNGGSIFTLKQINVTPSAAGLGSFPTWNSAISYMQGNTVLYNGTYWTSTVTPNLNNTPGSGGQWTTYVSPGITIGTIGTISPTQVDATWTNMSTSVADMGYDQSDGNLILQVQTGDAVTHPRYLIKVNGATGAIMWKIPLTYTTMIPGLNLSRIINGQLGLVTDAGAVLSINTLAGTITSSASPTGIGAGSVGAYFYDAITGTLYAPFNYNSGTGGAPTQLSGTPSTFHEYGVYTPGTSLIGNTYTISTFGVPAVVGFPFNSQGQLLRPATPQDTGAQVGPALGKKRRSSKYAILLTNSQSFTVGTDFTNQFPVPLNSAGGVPYSLPTLFSGVVRDTLSDDYSFDGMLAWATGTSCYPLTIASVGGFIQTSDD